MGKLSDQAKQVIAEARVRYAFGHPLLPHTGNKSICTGKLTGQNKGMPHIPTEASVVRIARGKHKDLYSGACKHVGRPGIVLGTVLPDNE